LAPFQKELAIVHAGHGLGDDLLDPAAVHAGLGEE
jgi:hypothetical protein